MKAPERRVPRAADGGESRLSHTVLYPLIGLILGLGSPVGAFILRFWLADPILKDIWVRSELSYNALFYWYMGVGSVTAFVLFGYFLGARSESQRVRNAGLRRRVAELHLRSVTDGLTGAYSHAFMQENLQLELEASRRGERPLSIAMLDLDDFKKINDSHGHLFGDRVLKEVTETISMNIRQADVLGRWGGEEFLVLMPNADEKAALQIAERVRHAVERAVVVDTVDLVEPPRRVKVSVSIGVAAFDGKESAVELLRRADANLYKAKHQGKNRVVA